MSRLVLFFLLSSCFFSAAYAQGSANDIFLRLSHNAPGLGTVTVRQPVRLAEAMSQLKTENAKSPGIDGFRVRIYRGLGQSARTQSEAVVAAVMEKWPGLRAYRSFESPYYKVTVGDCRTRVEALALRTRILSAYPQAFVISERVNFPPSFPLATEADESEVSVP